MTKNDTPLRLAIDFDGVLHDPTRKVKGHKLGVPIDGAVGAMIDLKRRGYLLVIHSVWADTDQKRSAMSEWCRFFGIPYDFITNVKPVADLYLDDKGYRFRTWDDAMEFIQALHNSARE